MSELLFECYHVPSVCYGVDALFSFFHNYPDAGEFCTNRCCRSNAGQAGDRVVFYSQELLEGFVIKNLSSYHSDPA